ncbi:large conductance mechanosensitive channel protein MscL [uncultured Jatrophihabitans sp.]|uniref:large conductance mechanosensitive channel protein MscL n=1 Tax=uncultured Jatrophihabitans sp. TaxID=1610747 RepID=UPI0035C9D6D4
MRGNVVDLAVAVVIGAAFGAVVNSLVKDIITPLIAAIGGKPDFSSLAFTVNKSRFEYGAFINAVVSFLIVAAAIYFLVVLPLNKVAERRAQRLATGEPDPEPKAEDVLLLSEIRDLLAGRGAGDGTDGAHDGRHGATTQDA